MLIFLKKIIFILLFSGYFIQFKYNATKWWNIFQPYCPDTWICNDFFIMNEENTRYDSIGNSDTSLIHRGGSYRGRCLSELMLFRSTRIIMGCFKKMFFSDHKIININY